MKIIWLTIVAIAAVVLAGMLTIQLPQVQTFLVSRLTERLSESIDADISFEKIHLKPFTTLVVKDLLILDRHPSDDPLKDPSAPEDVRVDTFFRADYIIARFTLEGLRHRPGIHIGKAYVDNAQMNLVLEDKPDMGDGDTSTDNLSRIFRLKKADPDKPKNLDEIFHIKKVEIHEMGFAMKNYESDRPVYEKGGIDWNDLDIKNINLNARDLMFKGGIMSGVADDLSFREKSGYRTISMSGDVKVGNGNTIINDLFIKDPWSDVYLPSFKMSYNSVYDFNDFISKVWIDGEIFKSILDFKTLSYFAPELEGNRLKVNITGAVFGYVDNFALEHLNVSAEDGEFKGVVSGSINGIPDLDRTMLDLSLTRFRLTGRGLGKFISEWMHNGSVDLSSYGRGITMGLDADVHGRLNSLSVSTDIHAGNAGSLDADVRIDDILNYGSPIGISGTLATTDLDLSRFVNIGPLHQTSLTTRFAARLGEDRTDLRIDTLSMSRLNLLGYDYSGIRGQGTFTKDSFSGAVVCNDPNLDFKFIGGFAYSPKTSIQKYKFELQVGEADLNALHLDKRGKSMVAFDNSKVEFTRKGKSGEIFGEVNVSDIILENKDGRHNVGDVIIKSHNNDSTDRYTLTLRSSFANAGYEGSGSVMDFIRDLKGITLQKELPAVLQDSTYIWTGNEYALSFNCHNAKNVMNFILPGLYVEDGTLLKLGIDKNGILDAGLRSDRIAYRGQSVKALTGHFSNAGERLYGNIRSEEMKIAGVTVRDNHIVMDAHDDNISLGLGYDNHTRLENKGELSVNGRISRGKEGELGIDMEFKPSFIFLNSKKWEITPSLLSMKDKGFNVHGFGLMSGKESINVNGSTAAERKDTLTLALDNFDISIANTVLGEDVGIRGEATGHVMLTSPMNSKGILIDMEIDSTALAGKPLGTLTMECNWNDRTEGFDIVARNDLDGHNSLDINAVFAPKGRNLDATIALDGLDVSYAQPFLTDVFSTMEGSIYGTVKARGPLDALDISSTDTRLEDAELTVAYTNVRYNADGLFHMDEYGVYFDDIAISDSYNGRGRISGSIGYDHFRDFRFATDINVEQIEAINIDEKNNDGFYGNIFGTGKVSIKGPMNSITMDIDAVTARSGQLHIPMMTSASSKGSNILTFKKIEVAKEAEDPYEVYVREQSMKDSGGSDFTINMTVNAQPEVEAFVEIDKSTGNVLSGRGSGILSLEVSDDVFNINGDYTISNGNYRFATMGLLGRDFQIQDGSSIRFNGDIMESTLNIDAIYKTKTSLSTLLSDSTSVSSRRLVECGIHITGKLANPQFDFSINVPDLDPTVKSRVESALSTKDKVQKQFLSLLVSNSFLPDEQSGIVNNSTLLYSNVMEMMNNQLNNIFDKLGIPMEMGLNYQPNDKGNDVFDLAMSTQLFNNRVVINGSVGNKQYNTSGTQNEVVGDIDIEIKINRPGSIRLNVFSHSADSYTNYLDNSQRSGFGIAVQTEFNDFRDLFRYIGNKNRQEARQRAEEEMLNAERVTLEIKAPEAGDGRNKDKKNDRRKR